MENEVQTPEMTETTVTTETTLEQTEATTEQKAKRPHVPREKFMAVWEQVAADLKAGKTTGSGIQLVADATGLQPNTVQQRATKYRTAYGLALTRMPRSGGARFDSAAANAELEAIKAKIANSSENGEAEQTNVEA